MTFRTRLRTWIGPEPRGGRGTCRACRHFRDGPATIEAALPGLASLSSGHASVRAGDGLCSRHDRFVAAGSSCTLFAAVSVDPVASF